MFPFSFNSLYKIRSGFDKTSGIINEKLSLPNCSLEDILDEDEVCQEIRIKNHQLIQFLNIERVKELIDYITVVPNEDEEFKGRRYPYYACEVLSCDENSINELFVLKTVDLQMKAQLIASSSSSKSKNLLSNGKPMIIPDIKEDNGKAIDIIDINSDEGISKKKEEEVVEQIELEKEKEKEKEINDDDTLIQQTFSSASNNNNSNENSNGYKGDGNADKGDGNADKGNDNGKATIINTVDIKSNQLENENQKEANPILNSQSNRLALFDYLIKFLDTDKELNYVLAGYFSKVILFLLNKYPTKLISYLYTEQHYIFEKLIFHSDKKAIGDIALKLLSLDSLTATGDNTIVITTNSNLNSVNSTQITSNSLSQIRNEMITNLFCQIDLGKKDFELDNLLNLCVDLIQSKELLLEFISNPSILTHLFKLLQRNAEETPIVKGNYSILLSFLIQLLKYIQIHNLDLPSNSSIDDKVSLDPEDTNHTPMSKSILYNLRGILRNFDDLQSKELQFQYGGSSKVLGVKCLRILELVKHLFCYFKDIPYLLDDILIRESFFKKAIEFFFKYQWNNVYHQHFINLFKLYINDEAKHLDISKHLFKELNFGNALMDKLLNEKFVFGNTGIAINSGYYSHLVYLCSKINVYTADIDTLNRSRLGSFNFVAISAKTLEFQSSGLECGSMSGVSSIGNSHGGVGMTRAHESIEIKNSLNSDWNKRFNEKVLPLIQVYESKLCDTKALTQDNEQDVNINDFAFENFKVKNEQDENSETPSEDNIGEISGSTPTANNIQQDTTNFDEEVEQSFNNQPTNDVIPVIESSVIVDELDSKNFTDLFYWKGYSIEEKLVLEALKDLELKK